MSYSSTHVVLLAADNPDEAFRQLEAIEKEYPKIPKEEWDWDIQRVAVDMDNTILMSMSISDDD